MKANDMGNDERCTRSGYPAGRRCDFSLRWLLIALPLVAVTACGATADGGVTASGFIASCQNMITDGIEPSCTEHYADPSLAANVNVTDKQACDIQSGTWSKDRCPMAGSLGTCKITGTGASTAPLYDILFVYAAPRITAALVMSSCSAAGGIYEAAIGTPMDAGTADAAGGDPNDGGPSPKACTTLQDIGSVVPKTNVTGSPPDSLGGTIADGTYVLTEDDIYPTTVPTEPPGSATIRVAGPTVEIVSKTTGIVSTVYSASTSGTKWLLTETCPSAVSAVSISYTATPTTLALTTGPEVQTYTKR